MTKGIVVLGLLLLAYLYPVNGLKMIFQLKDKEGKCFQDEIRTYTINTAKRVLTSMSVTSTMPVDYAMFGPGRVLHASGYGVMQQTFKFTTISEGLFDLCFTNNNREPTRISIDFTVGQKAMDWGSLTELNEIDQLSHQGKFALEIANSFEVEVEATIERFRERRTMQAEAGTGSFWLSIFFMLVFGVLMLGQHLAITKHLSKRKFI